MSDRKHGNDQPAHELPAVDALLQLVAKLIAQEHLRRCSEAAGPSSAPAETRNSGGQHANWA